MLRALGAILLTPLTLVRLPGQALRQRRILSQWSGGAMHWIEMAPKPNGCPGQAFFAPSPVLWQQRRVFGAQHALCLLLDRDKSILKVIAFRHSIHSPEDLDREAGEMDAFYARKGYASYSPLIVEEIGGERALRQRWVLGHFELTEWRFAHRGWLFLVGVFNRAPNEDDTLATARGVLDTWQWNDLVGS